jgi:hypothetical protein
MKNNKTMLFIRTRGYIVGATQFSNESLIDLVKISLHY